MQDEPSELPAHRVADFLRTHWDIHPTEVSYAPVGHGSHHWIATDHAGPSWFVTGDRLSGSRFAELAASAETARTLADTGCDFVLAPLPDVSGAVVRRVLPDWAMQVLPYLHGWSTDQGAWTDPDEQRAIARMVGRVHAATTPATVPRWDPTPLCRVDIEAALDEPDHPWAGPYGEQTRAELTDARPRVERLLHRYDELLAAIEADADPWVLTHGEPDSDNVVRTDDGRMFLIDWTSVAIAPRERDLFDVLQGPVDITPDYQETAGPYPARPAALTMFGLFWRLSHLGHDIRRLRAGADLPAAWERLRLRLDRGPGRWHESPHPLTDR